jgi:hypothetical protein
VSIFTHSSDGEVAIEMDWERKRSKDREFNKTHNLIFESAAPQHFQKLKPRF